MSTQWIRATTTARVRAAEPVASAFVETSLWSASADELLDRTASADPTPGGGSIAALSGAFGIGLVLMALAVTDDPTLSEPAARGRSLLERVRAAADADVRVYAALTAAYQLPRTDDRERAARSAAIEQATVTATDQPVELLEALAEARLLADRVEPRVKTTIVSDVAAGRDLVLGAARACEHTVDINLAALDRRGSAAAADLRNRKDAAVAALHAPKELA